MSVQQRTQVREELSSLRGETAIVTGGAMGIGKAIAQRLHSAGANVVIADPDRERHDLVDDLNDARSGSAVGVATDVSDVGSVKAMVGSTVEAFGGVDVLVNNAGIYPAMPLLDMDPAIFERVIAVNLTGLFLCTQLVARKMVASGRQGRIVNITSIDALHPSMEGLSHYDASKHGAWGFTKSSALELSHYGIRVNSIAPGGIATPGTEGTDSEALHAFEQMIPLGRLGHADEIANAALFLASDLSSYMTGSQIVVDGGRLLR